MQTDSAMSLRTGLLHFLRTDARIDWLLMDAEQPHLAINVPYSFFFASNVGNVLPASSDGSLTLLTTKFGSAPVIPELRVIPAESQTGVAQRWSRRRPRVNLTCPAGSHKRQRDPSFRWDDEWALRALSAGKDRNSP